MTLTILLTVVATSVPWAALVMYVRRKPEREVREQRIMRIYRELKARSGYSHEMSHKEAFDRATALVDHDSHEPAPVVPLSDYRGRGTGR